MYGYFLLFFFFLATYLYEILLHSDSRIVKNNSSNSFQGQNASIWQNTGGPEAMKTEFRRGKKASQKKHQSAETLDSLMGPLSRCLHF